MKKKPLETLVVQGIRKTCNLVAVAAVFSHTQTIQKNELQVVGVVVI